jgi:hypothetical protein
MASPLGRQRTSKSLNRLERHRKKKKSRRNGSRKLTGRRQTEGETTLQIQRTGQRKGYQQEINRRLTRLGFLTLRIGELFPNATIRMTLQDTTYPGPGAQPPAGPARGIRLAVPPHWETALVVRLFAAIAIGSLLLAGCTSTMTSEQRARVRAQLQMPPQSVGPQFGPHRSLEELRAAGEI